MSCLNVSVSRIGDGLDSQGSYAGERLKVRVSLAKKVLSSIASDVSQHLKANASRIGNALVVKCSIVCSLSEFTKWLNVSPSKVQWITDDVGIFYDVKSNVEWHILVDDAEINNDIIEWFSNEELIRNDVLLVNGKLNTYSLLNITMITNNTYLSNEA